MLLPVLSDQEFHDAVKHECVVLFSARDCPFCKQFKPVVRRAAAEQPTLCFLDVDCDAHDDIARAARIRGMPTIIRYHEGKVVKRRAGYMTAEQLRRWLTASDGSQEDE